MSNEVCKHCGMDIAIRNPSGFCDHLFYPNDCEVCALAWVKPDPKDEEISFLRSRLAVATKALEDIRDNMSHTPNGSMQAHFDKPYARGPDYCGPCLAGQILQKLQSHAKN